MKSKSSVRPKVSRDTDYIPDNFTFDIYNGQRWILPKGLCLSNSMKYKFNSLETTLNISKVKAEISLQISQTGFRFPGCDLNTSDPYSINEKREWKQIRSIFLKLHRFRKNLLALIFNWKIRKCIKNVKNTEDPGTLEIPKNPVYIIDFSSRTSFVYDATTLRRSIDNRILLSDYMFPTPKKPVNILTNKEFTFQQLYSLIKQCKKYGVSSWIFESLLNVSCDYNLFLAHNKQTLKLKAISSYFAKPPSSIRETIIDYFILESAGAYISDEVHNKFIKIYDTSPNMPCVQRWIYLTKQYYIVRELQDPTLLVALSNDISYFFDILPQVFNKPAIKFQNLFMRFEFVI